MIDEIFIILTYNDLSCSWSIILLYSSDLSSSWLIILICALDLSSSSIILEYRLDFVCSPPCGSCLFGGVAPGALFPAGSPAGGPRGLLRGGLGEHSWCHRLHLSSSWSIILIYHHLGLLCWSFILILHLDLSSWSIILSFHLKLSSWYIIMIYHNLIIIVIYHLDL